MLGLVTQALPALGNNEFDTSSGYTRPCLKTKQTPQKSLRTSMKPHCIRYKLPVALSKPSVLNPNFLAPKLSAIIMSFISASG